MLNIALKIAKIALKVVARWSGSAGIDLLRELRMGSSPPLFAGRLSQSDDSHVFQSLDGKWH